jgi:eukaryotic-like serine/threonine-protein kinase
MYLQPGSRVGEYQVTGRLGEGGFGIVYSGVHPEIGKKVAIKVLNEQASAIPEIVQRFKQEARVVNEIEHPNIIDIFAFGVLPDGRSYFVMELLEGRSMQELLRDSGGRLRLAELLPILRAVAEAVEAAHTRGVVHRDLKPDNIFIVSRAGGRTEVKVRDFGIAKLADSSLVTTRTGTPMGTPLYMSPEQCFGRAVDHRTDIYAFGVLAFHAITGRYPIEATSLVEIVAKHFTGERHRPSEFGAPGELDAPILRCLASEPDQRYPTLAAAFEALVAVAVVEPPPTLALMPRPSAPREKLPAPVASPQPATTLRAATGEAGVPAPTPPPTEPVSRRAWAWKLVTLVVLGGGIAAAVLAAGGDASERLEKEGPPAASMHPPPPAADATPADPFPQARNGWVLISEGSELLLGVPADVSEEVSGFRPQANIRAPEEPFYIQQHEVTWEEVEASLPFSRWLEANPAEKVVRPPDATDRHPAVGFTWTAARAYCAEFATGNLPTEEQWEMAARGPALSPYPWGASAIDQAATRIYRGASAAPGAVKTAAQDRTSDDPETSLYDLLGNAREWTRDPYRDDLTGAVEPWVTRNGVRYAIRGLPLDSDPPALLPVHGLAYRSAVCGTGDCVAKTAEERRTVGFRCVVREPPR